MTRKSIWKFVFAATFLFGLVNAWGVEIHVNSTADEADDDTSDGVCATASGVCTLRAAVQTANRAVGDNAFIYLPVGTLTLTRTPQGSDDEQSGDLNITNTTVVVVIYGNGAHPDQTIIDAAHVDRAFHVAPNASASINGLTIRNGLGFSGAGGAIINEGYLDLYDVTLRDNAADASSGLGGAIWNLGTLVVRDSVIAGNSGYVGGGLFNTGDAQIFSSTFSQNTAQLGGGIYSQGNFTMVNSTIADNNAHDSGGGFYATGFGTATNNVYNSTIAFNGADDDRDGEGQGGGLFVDTGVTFNIYNTLIAGNIVQNLPVADDCVGVVNAHARNLFGSTARCSITQVSGSTALLNSTALLGPLSDNGGLTQTIALLAGSNAIDAGLPVTGCLNEFSQPVFDDQRGFLRNVGGCDVGAFEYGAIDPNDEIFDNGFEGP